MAYPLSDEAQCAIGAAHKVERSFTRTEPTRSPTARGSAPSLDTRAVRASSNGAFSVSPVEHRGSGELRIPTQATKSGC
jgi:hypothetical protein